MQFSFLTLLTVLLSVAKGTRIVYIDSKAILHDISDVNQTGEDWIALAQYDNTISSTGWAQLEINTNERLNDSYQAYFSGLIEGHLTANLINQMTVNTVSHLCVNTTDNWCENLLKFLELNLHFTLSQITKYASTNPYWRQIELTLLQMKGIEDGRTAIRTGIASKALNLTSDHFLNSDVFLLNLAVELSTIKQAIESKAKSDPDDDHCSAIVKVLDDGSDLLVSHNTWSSYTTMLRILKKYTLNYRNVSGQSVVMSSYPGAIYSTDDFYIISNGLTVLETTNHNNNDSLWQNVVADQLVLEFIRNTVANRLARSGREWTELFAKFNSGTYNNQFMIVDYKKFQKGVHPSKQPDDLLWIIEQMPGITESADVTEVLRKQHYWPSYNVPYFKSIYEIGDQMKYAKATGITYETAPRARIFRRDQKNVTDMSSLFHLMQYNDFKNDPLSRCDICDPKPYAKFAIASRGDLNDPNGHYPDALAGFSSTGAIDVKMTNHELSSRLEMIAKSGPTFQDQPPFQWSKSHFAGLLHEGQPDLQKFEPVRVRWSPVKQEKVNL